MHELINHTKQAFDSSVPVIAWEANVVRLAWFAIVVGVILTAGSAFKLLLSYLEDPRSNDFVTGFLTAVGFWLGVFSIVSGTAMIVARRGRAVKRT